MERGKWTWASLSPFIAIVLTAWLLIAGYADILAGILAIVMAGSGVWFSAKGMARLKRIDEMPMSDLETAYRYRNAGIALGLTGSGLLVLSRETFLGRFISA